METAASEWEIVERVVAESRQESEQSWQALGVCPMVTAFTDGSAPLHNPAGPAGFAAILVGWDKLLDPSAIPSSTPQIQIALAGHIPARVHAPQTSNNRAEIAGIMAAMLAVSHLRPRRATIFSDSQYAVNCGTGAWKRNANLDLWERFDVLAAVLAQRAPDGWELSWIKGHAGTRWNEEADSLATRAALEFNEERYAALRAAQAATGREVPSQPQEAPVETESATTDWLAGHDYALVFRGVIDGQGQPNQGRGPAGGRYRHWTRTGRSHYEQVRHTGQLASAEASYATLIAALTDLISRIERAGKSPADYSIAVYTQDELVIKQLDGSYRVKAPGLQPLHAEAITLLSRFKQHTAAWKHTRIVANALKIQ
jgi:ribonuclease HI